MRPHHLLLLLIALVAGDDTKKCNRKDIKLETSIEIHYEQHRYQTSIARCKSTKENVPRAFKFWDPLQPEKIQKPYEVITCFQGEWKAKESTDPDAAEIVIKWTAAGLYKCADYCEADDESPLPAADFLIKRELMVKDNKQIVRVACKTSGYELNWYDKTSNNPVEGNYAVCTLKKWKAPFTSPAIISETAQAATFTCKKLVNKCAFLDTMAYGSLLQFKAKDANSPAMLTCAGASPIGDMLMVVRSVKDGATVDSVSITCNDATGKWKNTTGTTGTEVGTSEHAPLQVSCVEYCAATGERITAALTTVPAGTPPAREISCTANELGMFFDGKRTNVAKVTCTKDKDTTSTQKGWWSGQKSLNEDASTPQQIDCRKACEHDGLGMKYIDLKTGTYTPKCEIPVEGYRKEGIRLNDGFVYPSLKCNIKYGWTNAEAPAKVTIGDAFEKAKLRCVNLNCDHDTSCPADEKVGYECSKKLESSPLDELRCPDKHDFYDLKNAIFLKSGKLRCKGVPDKNWYIFYEERKTTLIGENLSLACYQKRCSKCKSLKGIADKDAGINAPGSTHECATVKCKGNMWSIVKKKPDNSPTEQYAGEVTCSSEKATDGEWLIDGKTPIKEGSCIPEENHHTVKCTEASPVDSKCDEAWPKAVGCVAIALVDTGIINCPTGKKIFFKQPGGAQFQGGDGTVTCWQGVWNVTLVSRRDKSTTSVDLYRGGTAICVDSNPTPPLAVEAEPKIVDNSSYYLLIGSSSVALLLFVCMTAVAVYKRTGSGYRLLVPNY